MDYNGIQYIFMMFPWSPSDPLSLLQWSNREFPWASDIAPEMRASRAPRKKKMAAVRVQDLNQQTIELGIPHLKKKPKAKQTFQVRRSSCFCWGFVMF